MPKQKVVLIFIVLISSSSIHPLKVMLDQDLISYSKAFDKTITVRFWNNQNSALSTIFLSHKNRCIEYVPDKKIKSVSAAFLEDAKSKDRIDISRLNLAQQRSDLTTITISENEDYRSQAEFEFFLQATDIKEQKEVKEGEEEEIVTLRRELVKTQQDLAQSQAHIKQLQDQLAACKRELNDLQEQPGMPKK
jgi:hypothetical protein